MCACSHPHAQSHAHTQFCTDHFARTLTAAHTFFTATLAHSNVGKKQHTAIVDSFKFVGLWPSPARNMGKPVGAQGKPVGAHGKTSRGPWPAPLKETRMPRQQSLKPRRINCAWSGLVALAAFARGWQGVTDHPRVSSWRGAPGSGLPLSFAMMRRGMMWTYCVHRALVSRALPHRSRHAIPAQRTDLQTPRLERCDEVVANIGRGQPTGLQVRRPSGANFTLKRYDSDISNV